MPAQAENPIQEPRETGAWNEQRLGRLFSELFGKLEDHFAVYDQEWRYVYVNDRAVKVLGKPREELLGRSIWELFPEARGNPYHQKLEECRRTGRACRFEHFYAPFGQWFENEIYPLGEEVAVISRDITERKGADERLAKNRAELALALRAGQMGTWEWTLEDGAVKWSDEVYALLGYERGAVSPAYEHWAARVHPEDRTRIQQEYEEALERKEEYASEYRIVWPDGSIRWIHVRGRPIFGREGRAISVSGVLLDVTRFKEANAQAARMERIYRAIGESIDYGIWVCEPDGKNIYASDSFLKLTGVTQQECSDFGWGRVLHPEDAVETIEDWKRCARTGAFWEREHRFKGVDGRWHPILARGVPIRDEQGRIECWAGINLDISAWKETERKIQEKEEFNRRIIESSQDCIEVLDLEGRLLWMNDEGARLLALPGPASMTGQLWAELWNEGERGPARKAVEAARAGESARFIGQFEVRNEPRWWDVRVTPILDSAGKPKELLAVSRDITASRLSNAALRESEERLRLAMEAGAIGTWDWDIPANRVAWSEKTYALHGVKPGEFAGTVEAFAEFVHPEDRERVSKNIQAALEGKAPYSIEFRVVHPSGVVRWVATSAKTLFDGEGRPRRMIGATADITERKEAERDLRADKEKLAEHAHLLEEEVAARTSRLRQTVQSLEGVAYTIAHDLRAPLRALNGFAQLVRDDYSPALDQTGREYLNCIAASAVRMDNLISDLLSFAKLSHSEFPVEPVVLDDKIERILAELAPELKAHEASVTIRNPVGTVVGNRTALRQVVVNLLVNAMKFVEPEVQPKLEIWSEREDERLRLYFRDNGIGISPEHQGKIFGLFQRLHEQNAYPGTGIGLAIVKKAVERMGGSVGVESKLGQGSCFWIDLPCPEPARTGGVVK